MTKTEWFIIGLIGALIAFLLFLIFTPVMGVPSAYGLEKDYQFKWCKAHNGKMEVVLSDDARVDCVTKNYAVEVDFAHKWAESIGQSLYYGIKMKKKPAVLLIVNPLEDKKYIDRINEVARKYHITVFQIEK